jgi:hypothetical protein
MIERKKGEDEREGEKLKACLKNEIKLNGNPQSGH